MNCANHPDVQAMAACRQCAKPLCAMCVYYRDGEAWCREHYEAGSKPQELAPLPVTDPLASQTAPEPTPPETAGPAEAVLVERPYAEPELVAQPDEADATPGTGETVVMQPAPARPEGETVAYPPQGYSTPDGSPTVAFPPPQQPQQWQQPNARSWEADPRLQPMPFERRPGWSEEPLQKAPNSADTMGIAGLALGALALPASFCCGIAAPLGVLLSLVGGGLCIAGLMGAANARNPQQTRTVSGIGLGLSVLSLLVGLCFVSLLFVAPFLETL